MNEVVVLTPERILEVTEDVLRRYGLAKATVVDVARALDVSHGSVYRHFPSKASLREAVAKRWLDRLKAPLLKIAEVSRRRRGWRSGCARCFRSSTSGLATIPKCLRPT